MEILEKMRSRSKSATFRRRVRNPESPSASPISNELVHIARKLGAGAGVLGSMRGNMELFQEIAMRSRSETLTVTTETELKCAESVRNNNNNWEQDALEEIRPRSNSVAFNTQRHQTLSIAPSESAEKADKVTTTANRRVNMAVPGMMRPRSQSAAISRPGRHNSSPNSPISNELFQIARKIGAGAGGTDYYRRRALR